MFVFKEYICSVCNIVQKVDIFIPNTVQQLKTFVSTIARMHAYVPQRW